MVLILLLFAIGTLLPILLVVYEWHPDTLHLLIRVGAASLLVLAVLAVAWQVYRRWFAGAGRRPPREARVARLAWRPDLDAIGLEAHCATFLRHQGWDVESVRSKEADGVFVQAARTGARALVLCQPRADWLEPLTLRTLAVAAAEADAQPVALSLGAASPAVAQAAEAQGVALLRPADLPRLAQLAARSHAVAEPATPPPP